MKKSYNNINFDNKINKRWVQRFFYKTSKVRANVTMLCGPSLNHHIKDGQIILASNNSRVINIYELDYNTYLRNIKDLKKLKNHKFKINIYNDDIINAKITRFIDLDFCDRLINNIHIVDHFYNKLKNYKPQYYKHILITFSTRGIKVADDIELLCKTLNIDNKFKRSDLLPDLYINKTNNYIASYIGYRDGMPMTEFSIQWK